MKSGADDITLWSAMHQSTARQQAAPTRRLGVSAATIWSMAQAPSAWQPGGRGNDSDETRLRLPAKGLP